MIGIEKQRYTNKDVEQLKYNNRPKSIFLVLVNITLIATIIKVPR
jgi:hypothetical protein